MHSFCNFNWPHAHMRITCEDCAKEVAAGWHSVFQFNLGNDSTQSSRVHVPLCVYSLSFNYLGTFLSCASCIDDKKKPHISCSIKINGPTHALAGSGESSFVHGNAMALVTNYMQKVPCSCCMTLSWEFMTLWWDKYTGGSYSLAGYHTQQFEVFHGVEFVVPLLRYKVPSLPYEI